MSPLIQDSRANQRTKWRETEKVKKDELQFQVGPVVSAGLLSGIHQTITAYLLQGIEFGGQLYELEMTIGSSLDPVARKDGRMPSPADRMNLFFDVNPLLRDRAVGATRWLAVQTSLVPNLAQANAVLLIPGNQTGWNTAPCLPKRLCALPDSDPGHSMDVLFVSGCMRSSERLLRI